MENFAFTYYTSIRIKRNFNLIIFSNEYDTRIHVYQMIVTCKLQLSGSFDYYVGS